MTVETFIAIICAIVALGLYIYLKHNNELWNYINWKLVWEKLWSNHK